MVFISMITGTYFSAEHYIKQVAYNFRFSRKRREKSDTEHREQDGGNQKQMKNISPDFGRGV